ncbi:VPS35 endosomal protein-sorting factor-like isoform X1 [Schistocerca americana]|uniref:VPS35 endosomal protein-sorting factor-like n=1 Tax=Schistocerca nitens TaxID=7011 RepID=UPI001F4F17A0|nr:VPS35 endosomal protein-sorting factor-like isoform X1 [Schistocerca americana]XP_049809315.1 VPS35 endosomal protein-sorting factor-like [Schistocerca nitens]XP_049859726.1 VPS35 endosomal protein-sorting factor-like isoform X1 [Schistocerca gregaria]XP_049956083.1 VPS35 endosomal protein-sorting factor-like [Schistocerca serialis cubense]
MSAVRQSSCEWSSRPRDYASEYQKLQSNWEEVTDHPLKPLVVTMTESRIARRTLGGSTASSTGSSTPTPTQDPLGVALDGSDPLSQFAKQEMDPLSKMAADMWEIKPSGQKKAKDAPQDNIEPWSSRKSAILSKFTTSEKLSIMTSFLSGGEKVVVKAQSSVVDKVKNRLEQLDDFEEGSVRQMLDLSQHEYTNRIEQLNQELVQAWHTDQRVKALKIAIQCSKLLVDTSVIQFYPSKFVLITDILDIFGRLVYERLRTKAEYYVPGSKTPTSLPEKFTPDMVPESAKETCRNWFYKIASIRELVPRLYVEMAILKSYSFLTSSEFSQALLRLTRMIRGIGDPLVAVYARCYLCRVGMAVSPFSDREYIKENFYDFLASYDQVFSDGVKADLSQQKVELSTYLTLYTPALDWILQGVAANAPESLLVEVITRCKEKRNSALLLNTVMAAFKPAYIASRASEFVELVSNCNEEGFPQYILFRTLGFCLVLADPPAEDRLQILNDVWRIVTKLEDPTQYISCAEVWVQFAVRHFSCREVNTFLGDIIRHMTPDRAYEQHYSQLQSVVDKILLHTQDFETLFTMDKFLPLLDMFQKESVKVAVCKSIMDSFATNHQESTNDPVITNALMFVCRVMHDSVNALTVEDEKRQIGNLISRFVKKVDYGRDFEQQLSFYVEARSAFTNLDSVHAQLVQCVNRLSVETRRIVKGHHTRKTAAFVRACAAYCYITIPSITSVFSRLELYLLSGQVALLNQCLGQADACFKAALSLIPELPTTMEVDGKLKSSEAYLVSYLCHFLSTLLVVPDNPEQGVLYLARGLMNVLQHYTWEANSSARCTVYLHVLDMLSAAAQECYPYHIEKVVSNDTLYGSDPKFIAEINKTCSALIDEILNHLKFLGANEQYKKQSSLALDLFTRIIIRGNLSEPSITALALNLWNLAHRHGQADVKLAARTIEYIKRKSQQAEGNAYSELMTKLPMKV